MFHLAFAPLPLLALLTPTRASAVETEVAGKPLVVDVTNTSVINYRFNNRNTYRDNITTILDDDYGEWLDRLNIQASWWKLRAFVRIDAATFFATPTPEKLRAFAVFRQPGNTAGDLDKRLGYENQLYSDLHSRYRNVYYPSKLFVGFNQPGLDITVGDYYAQLGRGLVFSARKIDELAVDTTVRGVKVVADHDFDGFRLAGTFLVGQMNPLRVDETSGRRLHGAGSPLFFGFPSSGALSLFTYDPDAKPDTVARPIRTVDAAQPSYFEDTVLGAHLEGGTKHFTIGGNTSILARKSYAADRLRCRAAVDGNDDIARDACDQQFPDFTPNNDPSKSHNTIVTYSGSLSFPSIAKHGDVYVEVAGQSLRDGHLSEPLAFGGPNVKEQDASGRAVYGSASFNAGPVAISLEGKHYRNFFPLNGNIDTTAKGFGAPEFNLITYNQLPTVEPIYTQPVSGGSPNVCIDGGRGRIDYRFNRDTSVYGWLGRYTSWTEKPGVTLASCLIDDEHKSNTWDTAVGIDIALDEGQSHARAWFGARTTDLEVATEPVEISEPTTTFYREGYIRYDLVKHLTGSFSLQAQGFHRRRHEPFSHKAAWTEGENYTALQWSPHLSAIFGYEYRAQEGCQAAYSDERGNHPKSDFCHYFNGGLSWRSNAGDEGSRTKRVLGQLFNTVNIYVGQRRGALRCVSGVCRQFPPFEGAKIEITSRF